MITHQTIIWLYEDSIVIYVHNSASVSALMLLCGLGWFRWYSVIFIVGAIPQCSSLGQCHVNVFGLGWCHFIVFWFKLVPCHSVLFYVGAIPYCSGLDWYHAIVFWLRLVPCHSILAQTGAMPQCSSLGWCHATVFQFSLVPCHSDCSIPLKYID